MIIQNKKKIFLSTIIFFLLPVVFFSFFSVKAKASECSDQGGYCVLLQMDSGSTCDDDEDYIGRAGCGNADSLEGCCVPKKIDNVTNNIDDSAVARDDYSGVILQDSDQNSTNNLQTGSGSSQGNSQGNPNLSKSSSTRQNANSNSPTPSNSIPLRNGSSGGLVPCTDNCTLCHLVIGFKNIYDYLLKILFAATTLVIVIAGIMYMISAGNKGMIEKAKTAFIYALSALVLALTAWLIINAVLHALGYKNVGNWYTFTCDTTQTKTEWVNPGGATLPGQTGDSGAGSGSGVGSYQASGNLSPKSQEVINNYINTQVGKKYGGDVHCWSTTNAAFTLSGLPDLGNRWKVWNGNPASIQPGCAMQIEGVHTFLVLENGATSSAPPNGNIGVNNDGLNYNINRAQKLGRRLLIIYPE